MDKMKAKIIVSETETKDKDVKEKDIEKKDVEEKDTDMKIGGSGLLQLIHDTIGRITDILQNASDSAHDDKDAEDNVEFEEEAPESTNITALPFSSEVELSPCDEKDTPHMMTTDELTDMANKETKPYGFEILNDNDFDAADPVVEHFKNDMGGCGGMIKILKISSPESLAKLALAYNKLSDIRVANRAKVLGEVFNHINAVASGEGARHQLLAIRKIDNILVDSSKQEQHSLFKAKEAILAGTAQHLDAAGYRVRSVYSQYVPEQMTRTAYTNLETQNGEMIMMPQGKHQLGHPTTLELSKFRDQSVDAKIDPNTGEITNGYMDFEKRRDNSVSARNRFEVHRNPVNDESLLTLAKDERSKPLTKNERSYEQRLDEDTKGRYNNKNWEKSREQALDDTKEAYLGHHGDPKEDESIARTLSKTAKYNKIDPMSDDTFGEQLSAGHGDTPDDKTLEEMLSDEHVGLTEDELNMLLNEWLDDSRKNEED